MIEIIQKENKLLRCVSGTVPVEEIGNAKIREIITGMKEALESQEDGVAIAAPQIGESLRIFVVSHRVFEIPEKDPPEDKALRENNWPIPPENKTEDIVFINPKIIKLSKKKEWMEEGCLSVRWLYGSVQRSTNATIHAYNEKGEEFTRGAGGLLAQIFQHEVDHLNGILFIDHAKNVQEILPEKS